MINWIQNTPTLFLVDSRRDYDILTNDKTEKWEVATYLGENKILLISPENYEKGSIHKYSQEEYFSLIKHELSHLFYQILSQGQEPCWLDEGFAIFSSGQLNNKKRIKKFENFLDYYKQANEGIYKKSDFAVEVLVKKFGKEKVLNFLTELPKIKNEENFKKKFQKHFGINLN